ncbi:MAG: response regulator [Polyangiaceae bacterium]|nr:response regulator [Polyangiaceae bacterium]
MANILIVDDDAVFGMLTQWRLQRAGHTATLIAGPLGVMAELKKGDFDLVLLDLTMPLLSGADLVRMIRSRGAHASLKIVLYSSADEDKLIAAVEQLGADGYARKSDKMKELVEAIDRVLER